MELDLNQLGLPLAGFKAVAAQSYTREKGYKEVLDRVGRPEITNLSLHDHSGSAPIKFAYNRLPVFQYSMIDMIENTGVRKILEPFQLRFIENIQSYDMIDGLPHWEPEALRHFANLLVDDFLVLDMSKSCDHSMNTFLEIEKSLLKQVPHASCGGRQLTDNIFQTLYAAYIGGLDASLVDFTTGFAKPYASSDLELSKDFPYLAIAWEKQWFIKSKVLPIGKKDQEGGGQ